MKEIIMTIVMFFAISNSIANPLTNTTTVVETTSETTTESTDDINYYKVLDLFLNSDTLKVSEKTNEINLITSTNPASLNDLQYAEDTKNEDEIELITSTIEITTFNPDGNEITSTPVDQSTKANNLAKVENTNLVVVQNSASKEMSFLLTYLSVFCFFVEFGILNHENF